MSFRRSQLQKTKSRRSWASLTPKRQSDAKLLGYNQNLWNKVVEPSLLGSEWEDLTHKEKEAASLLMKQIMTNYQSYSVKSLNQNNHHKDWKELTRKIRNAAKVLGYNEYLWDQSIEVDIMESEWKRLTRKQKKAAKILNYTEEKWDYERIMRLLNHTVECTTVG